MSLLVDEVQHMSEHPGVKAEDRVVDLVDIPLVLQQQRQPTGQAVGEQRRAQAVGSAAIKQVEERGQTNAEDADGAGNDAGRGVNILDARKGERVMTVATRRVLVNGNTASGRRVLDHRLNPVGLMAHLAEIRR